MLSAALSQGYKCDPTFIRLIPNYFLVMSIFSKNSELDKLVRLLITNETTQHGENTELLFTQLLMNFCVLLEDSQKKMPVIEYDQLLSILQ